MCVGVDVFMDYEAVQNKKGNKYVGNFTSALK